MGLTDDCRYIVEVRYGVEPAPVLLLGRFQPRYALTTGQKYDNRWMSFSLQSFDLYLEECPPFNEPQADTKPIGTQREALRREKQHILQLGYH